MNRFAILCIALSVFTLGCAANPEGSTGSKGNGSDAKIALISITSDPNVDLQEVNMGLTFAGFCVDEGYDVNIFLNVKGVKMATKDFSDDVKFKEYKSLKSQLVALSKRGVQVHVCPVCMKDFGITNEQIIPEAFVTSKPKLFVKLGGDTMVFTY